MQHIHRAVGLIIDEEEEQLRHHAHQLYLDYVRNTNARHHPKSQRFDELRKCRRQLCNTSRRRGRGGEGAEHE